MTKSLLDGTTWYWREGQMMAPIGSDFHGIRSKELCLPISEEIPIDAIREELENHQIDVHTKRIHQAFANYPEGTKILYAYCPIAEIEYTREYQGNLDALEHYVIENGGEIYGQKKTQREKEPVKLDFKSLFRLFGRGK